MALPQGMTKVVRAAWPRIDDTVTQALYDLGEDFDGSALEDVEPDYDMLGCGYWGCVYPTAVPRWVVKVSADPYEGPIAQAVMDCPYLRDHPGNAYILNMWQLAEKARWGRSGWRNVWVILREEITPIRLPLLLQGRTGTLVDLLHTIRIAAAATNKYDRDIEEKGRGRGRYRKLIRSEVLWLRGLKTADQTRELAVLSDFMFDFFEEFGARLADVHGGNAGRRRHDLTDIVPTHYPSKHWVTFDLGHSNVETGSEVPLLRNPTGVEII